LELETLRNGNHGASWCDSIHYCLSLCALMRFRSFSLWLLPFNLWFSSCNHLRLLSLNWCIFDWIRCGKIVEWREVTERSLEFPILVCYYHCNHHTKESNQIWCLWHLSKGKFMQLKVLNVIHADKGYQQTIVLFDQYM